MQISLNGQNFELKDSANLTELIALLGLEPKSLAIELNKEIAVKSVWNETYINEGDVIELVQFVGGG